MAGRYDSGQECLLRRFPRREMAGAIPDARYSAIPDDLRQEAYPVASREPQDRIVAPDRVQQYLERMRPGK